MAELTPRLQFAGEYRERRAFHKLGFSRLLQTPMVFDVGDQCNALLP